MVWLLCQPALKRSDPPSNTFLSLFGLKNNSFMRKLEGWYAAAFVPFRWTYTTMPKLEGQMLLPHVTEMICTLLFRLIPN